MTKAKHILIWALCLLVAASFPITAAYAASETTGTPVDITTPAETATTAPETTAETTAATTTAPETTAETAVTTAAAPETVTPSETTTIPVETTKSAETTIPVETTKPAETTTAPAVTTAQTKYTYQLSFVLDEAVTNRALYQPLTIKDSLSATQLFTWTTALPTKPGYTFLGWAKLPGATAPDILPQTDAGGISFCAYTMTSTMTTQILYPVWQTNTYYVNYTTNGGSALPVTSYTIATPITFPVTTKLGYTFSGWTVETDGTGNWLMQELDAGTTLPAGFYGNVTLIAKWTPILYTITYDTAGIASLPPSTYTIDTLVTLRPPSRPGYTFNGWTVASSDGMPINWLTSLPAETPPLSGLYGNVTLTPKWNEQTVTISYLTAGIGGTVTPPIETVGTDTGIPASTPIPAAGYKFVGWYRDATCTIPVDTTQVDPITGKLSPQKDAETGLHAKATYYAKFELLLGTLTIFAEGVDNDQSLIFNIVGTPTAEALDPISLTVVIPAGQTSVTITDLPIGIYTVTEQNGWSWRYAAIDGVTMQLQANSASTLLRPARFTFRAEAVKWLNDYTYKKKN